MVRRDGQEGGEARDGGKDARARAHLEGEGVHVREQVVLDPLLRRVEGGEEAGALLGVGVDARAPEGVGDRGREPTPDDGDPALPGEARRLEEDRAGGRVDAVPARDDRVPYTSERSKMRIFIRMQSGNAIKEACNEACMPYTSERSKMRSLVRWQRGRRLFVWMCTFVRRWSREAVPKKM